MEGTTVTVSARSVAGFLPYVGIRSFTRDEGHQFFGRSREVAALRALLYANRLVVLHAASGAGKTSLIHAGLVPTIEQDFDLLATARVGGGDHVAAGSDDNPFVANILAAWDPVDLDHVDSLAAALQARPRRMAEDGTDPLRLAILDQFEELFTWYPGRWRQRPEVIREIRCALETDPLLRVLIAVRDDYLGSLDPLLGELGTLSYARLHLDRLATPEAVEAIVGPLANTSVVFGEGVAERLATDLAKVRVVRGGETVEIEGAQVEPVHLQVVCSALWNSLTPGTSVITDEHWRRFGEVDRALRDFYDRGVATVAEAHRVPAARLESWFETQLVTQAHTRGAVIRLEDETAGLANEVVDDLEDLRLVRSEVRRGARWYELSHDRLVGVVDERRRERLTEAADRSRRLIRRLLGLAAMILIAAFAVAWYGRSQISDAAAIQEQALEVTDQVAAQRDEALGDVLDIVNPEERMAIERTVAISEAKSLTQTISEALGDPATTDERLETLQQLAASKQADLEAMLAEQGLDESSEVAAARDAVAGAAGALTVALTDEGAGDRAAEQAAVAAASASVIEDDAEEELTAGLAAGASAIDGPRAGGLTAGTPPTPTTTPRQSTTSSAAPDTTLAVTDPGDVGQIPVEAMEWYEGIEAVGGDPPYVFADEKDTGFVVFTVDIDEPGPHLVEALVDVDGQTNTNSFYLSIDGHAWVRNVAADDTLNVRAAPGVSSERIGELAPDSPIRLALDPETRTPVRSPDDDLAIWYRLAAPTEGWVHSAFVGWEIWDAFEEVERGPTGFAWDGVSTRCEPTDSFELHSCGPVRSFDAGSHTFILRGREPGTRLASFLITAVDR